MGSQCTDRVFPVRNGRVPHRENVGDASGDLVADPSRASSALWWSMAGPTPIRNDTDYNAALSRIDQLMGAERGSTDSEELDALADLVVLYESGPVTEWDSERKDDMAISDSLLPEFDQEIAGARRTLERVPADKFDWRPHPKSGTMVWLAGHLANLPSWAPLTIGQDELDLAPGGKQMDPPPPPADTADLVATFDRHAAEARAAIAGASDADLMKPWTLLSNGRTLMTLPKVAVLRSFVMNHLIHHRAQLGVYLRLNDIPVPSIYGPSADEAPPGF